MKLIDKNETLVSPEGFALIGVTAVGAYLRVEYAREKENQIGYVDIFLNDQGREVLRTEGWTRPLPEEPAPKPIKPNWWTRIIEGFKRGE